MTCLTGTCALSRAAPDRSQAWGPPALYEYQPPSGAVCVALVPTLGRCPDQGGGTLSHLMPASRPPKKESLLLSVICLRVPRPQGGMGWGPVARQMVCPPQARGPAGPFSAGSWSWGVYGETGPGPSVLCWFTEEQRGWKQRGAAPSRELDAHVQTGVLAQRLSQTDRRRLGFDMSECPLTCSSEGCSEYMPPLELAGLLPLNFSSVAFRSLSGSCLSLFLFWFG